MSVTARISLPGYNAETDTNLDHYSLYADIDNVLIKRQQSGAATINDPSGGSPTILTIPHNLGYIPFFMVYYFDALGSVWQILNNQNDAFSVPQQLCAVDTTNLYIYNFGGHLSGNIQVAYDIFYDDMSNLGSPSIVESPRAVKIPRPGIDGLVSTNPNDYIMHSDLNNFKILAQGIVHKDIANLSSFSFAHGANVQAPYKYLLFLSDDEDGKYTIIGGTTQTQVYDLSMGYITSTMNGANITIKFTPQSSSPELITLKYYVYGTGKDSTIIKPNPLLAFAKAGHNVLTETNPDNFNFHSAYPTLKYFISGTYSITVSTTTVITLAHNLNYIPCFIGFVNDLSGLIPNAYAIIPYYYGRSSIASPNRDIAVFMHADATNIYLQIFYQSNAIGTSKTFNFYYKLFKNNLGL